MFKASKICSVIEDEQKAKLLKKFKIDEKFPKELLLVNLNKVPAALYANGDYIAKLYSDAASESDTKKRFAVIDKITDKKVDKALSKFYGKHANDATCVSLMIQTAMINDTERLCIIATCTTRI